MFVEMILKVMRIINDAVLAVFINFCIFFKYFYNFLLLHMTLLACRVNLCGAKKKRIVEEALYA